jgi:hypothetical protein
MRSKIFTTDLNDDLNIYAPKTLVTFVYNYDVDKERTNMFFTITIHRLLS